MAAVEGKKKRKRRASLTSEEYKSHGWWLYIGKEPIHTHMGTGLEVNKERVVSISIGISG
jgi:hypothetical protein